MDSLLAKNLKIVDKDDRITIYSTERWGVGEYDCRTIITTKDVENNQERILYKGLPYSFEIYNPEYVHQYHHESVASMLAYIPNLEECAVTFSYEGTLLQIFFHEGVWYTTTRTNKDASCSRWSSTKCSFKDTLFKGLQKYALKTASKIDGYGCDDGCDNNVQTFYETVEEIYESKFRKDRMYCILVKSTEDERIVCLPSDNEILHVATIEQFDGSSNGSKIDYDDIIDEIPKPRKFKDYYEGINSVDYRYNQGLIIRCPTTGTIYKIIDPTYHAYFKLRNNQPNLKLRYLELRKYGSMQQFNDFKRFTLELYPEKSDWFEQIEDEIFELAKFIHGRYMDVYVSKVEDVERYFSNENGKYPRWLDYIAEIHAYYVRDLKLAKRAATSSGRFYRDTIYGRRDKSIATTISKILDIIRADWSSLKLNNALKWYQRVSASKAKRNSPQHQSRTEPIASIDESKEDESNDKKFIESTCDVIIENQDVDMIDQEEFIVLDEEICDEEEEPKENGTILDTLFENFDEIKNVVRGKRLSK